MEHKKKRISTKAAENTHAKMKNRKTWSKAPYPCNDNDNKNSTG